MLVGQAKNVIPDEYLASLHTRLYSVINRTSREMWKTKRRRTAASVEHTAASAQDDDEVFVTDSTLYTGDGEEVNLPHPGPNPLG